MICFGDGNPSGFFSLTSFAVCDVRVAGFQEVTFCHLQYRVAVCLSSRENPEMKGGKLKILNPEFLVGIRGQFHRWLRNRPRGGNPVPAKMGKRRLFSILGLYFQNIPERAVFQFPLFIFRYKAAFALI